MEWILGNLGTIWAVLSSVITIAAVVSAATPNTSDDAVVDILLKIVNRLGFNVRNASNDEG